MQQKQDEFLKKLFRGHFHELELYAQAILGNRGDAQVAVQNAFHIACEKIEAVIGSENPIGWMKLTVKNIAKNMIKQKKRDMKMLLSLSEMGEAPGQCDGVEFVLLDFCKSKLSAQEYEMIYSMKAVLIKRSQPN